MKSSGIGGQAVLEGVMMRNKSNYAVAVRKPDGEIAVTHGKCKSLKEKALFFRLPVVRGVISFCESLVIGMRTLTYSASFYEEEEEKKQQKRDTQKEQDVKEKIWMGVTVAASVLLAVGVFMLLPYFLSQLLSTRIKSYALLAFLEGVIRAVLFIGYIVAISCMKDIRRTFMYHGAEHKVINCIENGLELTPDNVRRQSKHHKRCGTSFLFLVIFLSIIFFMFLHFGNMWLRMLTRILLVPVIAGISYEFITAAGNSDSKLMEILGKPGMWMQMLTTREPDNKMIEVAIVSVEEVFDWREYQKRCISVQKGKESIEKRRSGENASKKQSRAKQAEALKRREEENNRRAHNRAKELMERERREAELEKIVEEAEKRKSKREAMQKAQEDDSDALANLDIFFDDVDKEEKES